MMTASKAAAFVFGALAVAACEGGSSRVEPPPDVTPRAESTRRASSGRVELVSSAGRETRGQIPSPDRGALQASLPRGIPPIAVPADNPMSDAKIALGRRLFYDTRLSGSGRFACATCHQQRLAFTDGRAQAIGSTGARHRRGAMSLTNVAYNASFGWADQSARTLEQQMMVPLFNEHPIEMGLAGRIDAVVARFAAAAEDVDRFRAAFPDDANVSLDNIVKAIATFERTLISGDSPLDRYLYRDDRSAMSPSALRGMALFFSDRLRCAACHAGFNLSGPVTFDGTRSVPLVFHNTGLHDPAGPLRSPIDRGLFDKTGNPEDMHRFRAPTLRNIAVTAPYMHDGSLATLEAVLAHYASGGKASTKKSRLLRPFDLSPSESADVVAFLMSLTDHKFLTNPAFAQ